MGESTRERVSIPLPQIHPQLLVVVDYLGMQDRLLYRVRVAQTLSHERFVLLSSKASEFELSFVPSSCFAKISAET